MFLSSRIDAFVVLSRFEGLVSEEHIQDANASLAATSQRYGAYCPVTSYISCVQQERKSYLGSRLAEVVEGKGPRSFKLHRRQASGTWYHLQHETRKASFFTIANGSHC